MFFLLNFWHFIAAHHHQSAVEARGGAGDREEPHKVKEPGFLLRV